MLEQIDGPSFLIIAAVGTYIAGFLLRNQMHLRLLVFGGSLFYIWYYAVVGPLWDAILGSSLIALASLQGVLILWWNKQSFAVPRTSRHIFAVIGNMEPGLFRQLIRAGNVIKVTEPTAVVHEGQPVETLWFLVQGNAEILREGLEPGMLTEPGFIGEIAWVAVQHASATVVVEPGAELVRWRARDLRKATRRSPRLQVALEALIAQDLARKLGISHPIARDKRREVNAPEVTAGVPNETGDPSN